MAATQVLGGRYRLVEQLGRGGTSVVWRAYDQALGRPVALKLLTARYLDHASVRTRILTEAQAAARLSHPHITSVFDYGEAATEPGSRTPYVVMELLSGSTLAEQLRSGPLPVQTALQVCAQVAGALAAAHRAGVVHRDIKPGNVMLTPTGAKVLDFGLAAAIGAAEEFESGGEVWGTPAYLAPERLTSREVVPAADVYALGLLLYAALTGRRPWPAKTSVSELLDAHRYEPPEPLPLIAGLPAEVTALCHRCLAKEARDRPTAREVAQLLARAAGWRVSLGVPAWPLTPPVRTAVPRAQAIAGHLDEFPTGPTVVQGGLPARAGASRWRALALSGSAAAVLGVLLTGLSVVPEPGEYGMVDDLDGRLGSAGGYQAPANDFDAGDPVRQSGPADPGVSMTTGSGGDGGSGGGGGGSGPTSAAPSSSPPPTSDPPTSDPPTGDPPASDPQPSDPTSDPPVTQSPDADPDSETRPPSSPTPQQPEDTSGPLDQTPDQQEQTAAPAGTP